MPRVYSLVSIKGYAVAPDARGYFTTQFSGLTFQNLLFCRRHDMTARHILCLPDISNLESNWEYSVTFTQYHWGSTPQRRSGFFFAKTNLVNQVSITQFLFYFYFYCIWVTHRGD